MWYCAILNYSDQTIENLESFATLDLRARLRIACLYGHAGSRVDAGKVAGGYIGQTPPSTPAYRARQTPNGSFTVRLYNAGGSLVLEELRQNFQDYRIRLDMLADHAQIAGGRAEGDFHMAVNFIGEMRM